MKIIWLRKQLDEGEDAGETPMPVIVGSPEAVVGFRSSLRKEGFIEVGGGEEGSERVYLYIRLPEVDYEVAFLNIGANKTEVKYNALSAEELKAELDKLSEKGDLYKEGEILRESLEKFLSLRRRPMKVVWLRKQMDEQQPTKFDSFEEAQAYLEGIGFTLAGRLRRGDSDAYYFVLMPEEDGKIKTAVVEEWTAERGHKWYVEYYKVRKETVIRILTQMKEGKDGWSISPEGMEILKKLTQSS